MMQARGSEHMLAHSVDGVEVPHDSKQCNVAVEYSLAPRIAQAGAYPRCMVAVAWPNSYVPPAASDVLPRAVAEWLASNNSVN